MPRLRLGSGPHGFPAQALAIDAPGELSEIGPSLANKGVVWQTGFPKRVQIEMILHVSGPAMPGHNDARKDVC